MRDCWSVQPRLRDKVEEEEVACVVAIGMGSCFVARSVGSVRSGSGWETCA